MKILKMEDLGLDVDNVCFKSKYTLENGDIIVTETHSGITGIRSIPPVSVNDIRIANEMEYLLKHGVLYNECKDFFKRPWM